MAKLTQTDHQIANLWDLNDRALRVYVWIDEHDATTEQVLTIFTDDGAGNGDAIFRVSLRELRKAIDATQEVYI